MHNAPLGIVGCAQPSLSATELERPQPPPSWGRFFVSFLGRSKAEFNGVGGLRTYIRTRAGPPPGTSTSKAASARPPELGPFLLGGRYRVLAELGHSPFQNSWASKTQFNGVGRLRTYISFMHSAF
jgi:hypothetical protein